MQNLGYEGQIKLPQKETYQHPPFLCNVELRFQGQY